MCNRGEHTVCIRFSTDHAHWGGSSDQTLLLIFLNGRWEYTFVAYFDIRTYFHARHQFVLNRLGYMQLGYWMMSAAQGGS